MLIIFQWLEERLSPRNPGLQPFPSWSPPPQSVLLFLLLLSPLTHHNTPNFHNFRTKTNAALLALRVDQPDCLIYIFLILLILLIPLLSHPAHLTLYLPLPSTLPLKKPCPRRNVDGDEGQSPTRTTNPSTSQKAKTFLLA